jgi:hypothetical protein
MLAPAIAKAADKDKDGKVTAAELKALAGEWFGKFDTAGAGSLSAEQLGEGLSALLPPPPGFPPPGGGPGGGRAGFGPGMILGPGFLMATDVNKDGSVSHTEWTAAFGRWAAEWDADKTGLLTEGQIADGLGKVLPRPQFGGPGRFPGGPPGTPGGMRGPGGGGVTGVELDPLIAAKDDAKPLVSKLLAVPSLRAKYLAHVREIAEKHLDWARLGPKAKGYHDLIAAAVRADTRKLESTEDFEKSVEGPDTGSTIPIRAFAEQRRAPK